MTRVYIADTLPQERLALRLTLLDLNMEIAGEAENWSALLAQLPLQSIDLLVADWELLLHTPDPPLAVLRQLCPKMRVIVLINGVGNHQHAASSAGVDGLISRSELPEWVAKHLRNAAAQSIP